MARPKIINKFGTLVGWNNITANLLGRELEGIEAVEYKDEQEVGIAHGAGPMPVGKTKGQYKCSASITLLMEESIALQQQLPKGSRIFDIPDFDLPIQYEYNGSLYKDVIRNCSFADNGVDVKTGDGKIAKKFTLVPSHIDWNV